ncbi:MAG: hypothetical protein ACE5FL_06130 [Myxococcota bacterium]
MSAEIDAAAAEVQARVRRFAVLRGAQRILIAVTPPHELEGSLEDGRRILRRLRAISGDRRDAEVVDIRDALAGVDALLEGLAVRIRDELKAAPIRAVCNAVAPLAEQEPGTVRALASLILEGDLESDPSLRLVEYIVTALSCVGVPGLREVVRSPLDALPELCDLDLAFAHEGDPAIDEAEQIFGRAVLRLEQDDLGATRDRIRDYKRKLGSRILNPTVLAAAVRYNVAMGNCLARLIDHHRTLDSFADTLLGPQKEGALGFTRGALAATAPASTGRPARRSRLFWQALGTVGLSLALLSLAVYLWPRSSVEVLEADFTSDVSPYLVAGYVSGDDGVERFVGTLGEDWETLDLATRRRVVARIAARMRARGVDGVILVDTERQIQARHEGDVLLWVTSPRGAQ